MKKNTTSNTAASAAQATFFKPLKPFSEQEYVTFKNQNTVPNAEKIDYAHKPRSTTGGYLEFISKTRDIEHNSDTKQNHYYLSHGYQSK